MYAGPDSYVFYIIGAISLQQCKLVDVIEMLGVIDHSDLGIWQVHGVEGGENIVIEISVMVLIRSESSILGYSTYDQYLI
jgi:hypothetical protein